MTVASVGSTERPYVDRPVEDISAAEHAARDAAVHWGLPQPRTIRAGMNLILRAGPHVLRVGRPTVAGDVGLRLAAALLDAGVRVAPPTRHDVVDRAGLTVTCWRHIDVVDDPVDWREVGAMVRRVHELPRAALPSDYPLPSPRSFPWWQFEPMLADLAPAIDPPALDGLRAAVSRWPDWWSSDDPVVCHGDVHPGNVLMSRSGPVLIDWDLMCVAPRGWDHGPMITWHDRWGGAAGEYEQLAAGYGADLRDDPAASAAAELRLVAATLMRVRAGRTSPAARREADRRLAYWRGDPAAPAWEAQ